MLACAARYGATNVRVFGSVARGEDRAGSDVDPRGELADRMRQMEQTLAGMGKEVRTCRLVVIDRQDERIGGEVEPDGTAELRLDLPGRPRGNRTSVRLFSNPGTEFFDLPPGVGIHLWLDGDPVEEFDVWLDDVVGE